ncbi:MAG: hypothetical protein WBR18_03585 [Anaerolineales bacterium]
MIEINGRELKLDASEGLLPWTDADHVVWLAMNFLRHCPVDGRTGLPWYLAYSCFWTDPLRPADWPDNPAGKFAMAVETLVRYQAYTGETWFLEPVRLMLDRLIAYHAPEHFAWPGVPYASAEPAQGVYFGARADGHHVTEPDKVAQAALGYLRFFKIAGDEAYLRQAEACARVLAEKCQAGDADHSPWPFRVDVRDDTSVELYSSHVIVAIRLFDELLDLGLDQPDRLAAARDAAWNWLMAYPLQNGCWKGYFEDIRLDPENQNRDQYSALETARYLLQYPARDPDWRTHVKAILEWVVTTLGSQPFFESVPIHEQLFCYHVMGSHTARMAAICAQYAALTGESQYADLARRNFGWASYMVTDEGYVHVGVDPPDYYNQCWFTDGYFDFVPHFLDGMLSLPDLSPSAADHLLGTTSIVTSITYSPREIEYQTFDASAAEVLKLTFVPQRVLSGGIELPSGDTEAHSGWIWDEAASTLRVQHDHSSVEISG